MNTMTNDLSGVVAADRAHVWHHLSQHKQYETVDPRVIVEGKGLRVWDAKGKEYIDAVSGAVWTVNVGYGRESIAKAVADQLVKMNYFAGSNGTVPGALFAEKLITKMPGLSRVYYSNSGSEANEKVYKMVRQISHRHHGGMKNKILYRERDYHGTTIGTLATSGQAERAKQYGPYPDGFVMVPHCLEYRKQWDVANYGERAADAIEEVILREGADTIGCLVLEPVTAGGGVIVPPKGYLAAAYAHVRKAGGLCLADEVQVGFGRIGSHMWAFEAQGVVPDIVTLGKPIGNGHPMAAVITTPAIANAFANGMEYFNTFGGNPVSAAIGLAVLDVIRDERLMAHCQAMGERLMDGARELAKRHEAIGDVRGLGLFNGIELVQDRATLAPAPDLLARVITRMKQDHQILLSSEGPLHNVLKIKPPAAFSAADCDRFLHGLDQALAAG